MANTQSPAGIQRLDGIYYYVENLERSRHLYVDQLDFPIVAGGHNEEGEYLVFEAKRCRYFFVKPAENTEGARFIKKHTEGIGRLVFEVKDLDAAYLNLEARGATPIEYIKTVESAEGKMRYFDITTPFGDCNWRFVQKEGNILAPGMVRYAEPQGGKNCFEFEVIDHITSNFRTLAPAILWMEHVMGFERYWGIEFHTEDVNKELKKGSGLKSIVMRDPHSGLKFANNEPKKPFFYQSQIQLFVDDLSGDGVQHTALAMRDIVSSIQEMTRRGVRFLKTPKTYYEMLPTKLKQLGVDEIDEDIDVLQSLGILVDGHQHHKYLLQIFLEDSATLFGDKKAGPFFLELIQRKGDPLFGGNNFRSLFESLELQHRQEGRL